MKRLRVIILICLVIALTTATLIILNWRQPPLPPVQSGVPTPSAAEMELSCVDGFPDSILIGQKIMVAAYNDQLDNLAVSLQKMPVGGVLLMDEVSKQTLSDFGSHFTIPLNIAVDQEGGTVQRFRSEGALPGATDMASKYSLTKATQLYTADAKFLADTGITTNFAPVVGVMSHVPSPLPGRMYSSDSATVVNYATVAIKAAQSAGINPIIKHFPGLGSTSTNTDTGVATTDPLRVLESRDILPYQQLAPLNPDVMVSSAIVPDLTNGQPALWSSTAVNLLRSYGYNDSVIYTDSLTAKAVPASVDDAALRAWEAGIDVALIVQTHDRTSDVDSYLQSIKVKAMNALQQGKLKRDEVAKSVRRILTRKHVNPCDLNTTAP